MESFVLNLFSDQLSKIIYNFHQSQINASFLSGKGSITNVRLNVDLINELLRPTVPFLEFTDITLSELRVEVTSYTNLKKAPIVLVIEEIHAKAREPLDYHVDPAANNAQKKKRENDGLSAPHRKPAAAPQQYGLLHRILDNLSVKIKRIHLSFSSLGKLKTRRRGIWTPPTLQVSFDNVEWICVTEGGNPGSPEAVWAHNELSAQQSRFKREAATAQHRHRSYTIYKRLSMLCNVQLLPAGDDEQSKGLQFHTPKASEAVSNLISDTRVDVHLAYIRRLRDACITGADLDVQIHEVDINLDVASYAKTASMPTGCDVGAFLHMLVGLLHCYYKDRSFEDPLLPKEAKPTKSGGAKGGLLRGFGAADQVEEEEEVGPDEFLPEVALMDDDLESSDESDYEDEPDEEHDEAFLAWKKEQGQKEGNAEEAGAGAPSEQGEIRTAVVAGNERNEQQRPTESPEQSGDGAKADAARKVDDDRDDQAPDKSYKRKRKAVIVVASGAQKFEKLSASLSIPRINMKLCIPGEGEMESHSGDSVESESSHHCLELLLEGLVAECIWPKNKAGEMGGHIQGSIKYLHLLESAYRQGWGAKSGTFGPQPWNVTRMFPLLRIGSRLFQGHDAFGLSPRLNGPDGGSTFSKCDEFPMMENRETTWTWDRQIKGSRALAFKSTISFVDETLTRWSRTNVQHEASLGELEVILDSAPVERLVNLFSNPGDKDNRWFDGRWFSGDWHAEIPWEIVAIDDAEFSLRDHLQPLPSLYPKSSRQSPLSSALRSVTAHFDSVTVRLPNPKQDLSAFRMADVIFNLTEATVLVSSDLPSSFLSGTITPDSASTEFPHDPSDVSCVSTIQQPDEDGEKVIFRMQISLTDCSVNIVPANACSEDAQLGSVLLPTNVTMMMSLESEPSLSEMGQTVASQSLIFSVLLHRFDSNIELRSAYCALETIEHHFGGLIRGSSSPASESVAPASKSTDVEASNSFSVVCIHVPEVDIHVWGERASKGRLSFNVSESKREAARPKHDLLCRVKAGLFEFGMDFTTEHSSPSSTPAHGSVFKCGISTVSIEICSRTGGDDLEMVEILSLADRSPLIESATAFCFPDEGAGSKSRGFLLRSEKLYADGSPSTTASAVEIASPLVVDFNIDALQFFLNHLLEGLLAPVFVGSTIPSSQIRQIPLGSAMWTVVMGFVAAPSSELEATGSNDVSPSLFRMSVEQLLVLIPSEPPYGLFFTDIDLAVGDVPRLTADMSSANYRNVVEKQCGHGGRTWLGAFRLLEPSTTESNSFYVLKGKHALLRVSGCRTSSPGFQVVLPDSSINWSSPVGLGGASAPPFDVGAVTDLGLIMMNMGMPLSSLYFKLYKLTPDSNTDQSTKLALLRLHNEIGSYHCKISAFVGQMNAEIGRLREAVFFKESERVAALALASSTAAGWVRVAEELSFSHRIFSSATFWRYWMVVDRNLLILSKAPGARPSFLIPLRASTQLRNLSMSSSSNKAASGIVSRHAHAKGFAVFDSEQGISLFFVAFNESDHNMWTRAISMVLGDEDVVTEDTAASAMEATDPLASFEGDGSIGVNNDLHRPVPSEAQSFSSVAAPQQAPNFDPSRVESSVLPAAEPVAATVDRVHSGVPGPSTEETALPAPIIHVESFDEGMDDVDMMDDVSLSEVPNDSSAVDENASSTEMPAKQPLPAAPPIEPAPAADLRTPPQEPQATNKQQQQQQQQQLPMRERLALAKGKSKLASTRFGSALKTAKGGVLAASEMGRAMAKEPPQKEEMRAAVGQKMSLLKQNASTKAASLKQNAGTKLAAARSSVQDQMSADAGSAPPLSLSSSRDELSRTKAVVGQKISSMKQSAGTKLTSLGASESVSNTMRRLKIDEKIAAVKSGVKNDPMVRSLSQSIHTDSSNRQRLGIGDDIRAAKPIKFDARETFAASSELPLKLKNVSTGGALLVDKDVTESIESLEKLGGTWTVTVDAVRVSAPPLSPDEQPSAMWTYNITATDIGSDADDGAPVSVQRSLAEVLRFHTTISEIMVEHLPSSASIAEVVSQGGGAQDPLLKKVSPLERLRVSGTLLRSVLEVDAPALDSNSSILRDNRCRSIKVFVSTLLECRMPQEAVEATKAFLNLDEKSSPDAANEYGTYLTNGVHYVNDAYDHVSNALAESDRAKQGGSLDIDARREQDLSLLSVLMEGYVKAIKERDEALASLSTTSILTDNRIIQDQRTKSNGASKANSSDEDMVQLCKQLGTEISLRTAAETEVNRLNEIVQAALKEINRLNERLEQIGCE